MYSGNAMCVTSHTHAHNCCIGSVEGKRRPIGGEAGGGAKSERDHAGGREREARLYAVERDLATAAEGAGGGHEAQARGIPNGVKISVCVLISAMCAVYCVGNLESGEKAAGGL